MAYCGEQSAVKREQDGFTAVSLRCRSWTCPDCTDTRKRALIAQGIGGNPTKFITLTSRRRPNVSAEAAAKELSRAWRLVRLRIMRKAKLKQLPFLAVIEKHASGWPHLHILARMPFFPQKVLSAWMAEICDGPNVWIEHLDKSHKAAIYAAKYCGKCKEKIGTAKRYWQSRDYDQRDNTEFKQKYPPGWGWEMWSETLEAWIRQQQQLGRSVERLSPWKAKATLGPWDRPP